MHDREDAWRAREAQRWLRPDANRWMRPDAERWQKPDARPRPARAEALEQRGAMPFDTRELDDVRHELSRLRGMLARIKFELLRRRYLARKYNPNQPRVPAGNPDGGQWTAEGSAGAGAGVDGGVSANVGTTDRRVLSDATPDGVKPGEQYAQGRDRPRRSGPILVKIGDRLIATNEWEKERLDAANHAANEAIRRVNAVDQDWKPREPFFEQTIDGEIRKGKDLVLQPEARLVQLGHLTPERLIDTYRSQHSRLDLFGREVGWRDQDVVAVTIQDGMPIFGTNSHASPYQQADRMLADQVRERLIERYPDIMSIDNVGGAPNNALYHAEATALLRAARANRGSLGGRSLDVYVDRTMCESCDIALPLLSREFGNPTVTFFDLRAGGRRILRDGVWQ